MCTQSVGNVEGRDNSIDFIKGIAVLLVLWGHAIQYLSVGALDFFEDRVFRGIYSFHMPLFMFLSGYVFYWSCRKYSLTRILSRRFNAIGIPMFMWGLIKCILFLPGNFPYTVLEFIKSIIGNALGLWFLWAVLVASMINAVIFCKVSNSTLQHILMFFAVVLLCVMPGNRNTSLYVYPYFVIGFIANEKNFLIKKYYKAISLMSLVGWVLLLQCYERKHYIYLSGCFLGDPTYIGWEQIGIDTYRFLVGLLGTVATIYLFSFIYRKSEKNGFFYWLIQLGKHSLEIYIMQGISLELLLEKVMPDIVTKYGYNILAENILLFEFVICGLCALMYASVLLFVAQQIEKRKILNLVLFGK